MISQIATRPVSRQAQVTWTTDEPSSSVVEYRQGTGAWQTRTGTEALETRHTVVVTGLACATTYSFRVKSADALGNLATSGESSLDDDGLHARRRSRRRRLERRHAELRRASASRRPGSTSTATCPTPTACSRSRARSTAAAARRSAPRPTAGASQRARRLQLRDQRLRAAARANYVELRATDNRRQRDHAHRDRQLGRPGRRRSPVGHRARWSILAAHPDDESLGMAGIIERAKTAGRRVYVVLVTNGEGGAVGGAVGDCGAPARRRSGGPLRPAARQGGA